MNLSQYAFAPGSKLLPDFFLDEYDDFVDTLPLKSQTKASAASSVAPGGKVQEVFDRLGKHLNEEIVRQAQAVYLFKVTGGGRFI